MNKFDNLADKCNLCSSPDTYKFHIVHTGEQIYKCRDCRVQFMNPQLSDEYLTHYYSSYIRDESDKEESMTTILTGCLSVIEKLKPEKGKILDIGSGNGFLLKAAKQRGWIPTGHEINCDEAAQLSNTLKIEVLCGNITEIKFNKKFNAVTMIHVMEHLKNPLEYLLFVKSILNKKGILFLTLPNILNRSVIFKLFLEKIKVKRKKIASFYEIEHHLWYFSPYSIRKFLESNGFDVLSINSGYSAKLNRSLYSRYLYERVSSKFFWHSCMEVIARRKE